MTAARIGVALGADPPEALLLLCRALARVCAVADAGDLGGTTDPELRRRSDPLPLVPGRRRALWVDDGADDPMDGLLDAPPAIVVSSSADAVAAARSRGLRARRVPQREIGSGAVPVPPFVRERVRRLRGLPACPLLAQDDSGWTWNEDVRVEQPTVATALAAAAAAVVLEPDDLVHALAWGCPAVTVPAVAASAGAVAGQSCLVAAGAAERVELARAVAADDRTAARLSWRGRLLFEQRHSADAVAGDVIHALRVPGPWAPSSLDQRLAELDSGAGAAGRHRFDEMVTAVVNPRRHP